jgi:hypothetical protein
MKRLLFISVFLLFGLQAFSQNGTVGGTPHFIRFNNYSVEQDKLVREALKGEKITYVCIPSGVISIEIAPGDVAGEERITGLLTKVTGAGSFEFFTSTTQEVESVCAGYRKPD